MRPAAILQTRTREYRAAKPHKTGSTGHIAVPDRQSSADRFGRNAKGSQILLDLPSRGNYNASSAGANLSALALLPGDGSFSI